jgi:hypothetical protein
LTFRSQMLLAFSATFFPRHWRFSPFAPLSASEMCPTALDYKTQRKSLPPKSKNIFDYNEA